MRAALSAKKVFVTAEKVFTPVFGQPLVLAEIKSQLLIRLSCVA
jgi:hypothetical protein